MTQQVRNPVEPRRPPGRQAGAAAIRRGHLRAAAAARTSSSSARSAAARPPSTTTCSSTRPSSRSFPAASTSRASTTTTRTTRAGLRWYRSHFPLEAGGRHIARPGLRPAIAGEASPYYLFHPLAAERLARDFPAIRIIVNLRDPVERAYSHYKEATYHGRETLSFEAALDAEDERLRGEAERIVAEPGYLSVGARAPFLPGPEPVPGHAAALVLAVSPRAVPHHGERGLLR